MAFKLLTKEY